MNTEIHTLLLQPRGVEQYDEHSSRWRNKCLGKSLFVTPHSDSGSSPSIEKRLHRWSLLAYIKLDQHY
jgi:hypothetical protein